MSGPRGKAPKLMPESPDVRFGWIAQRLRAMGLETGRVQECEALATGVEMLRANFEREYAWTGRLAGDICELRLQVAELGARLEAELRRQAQPGSGHVDG